MTPLPPLLHVESFFILCLSIFPLAASVAEVEGKEAKNFSFYGIKMGDSIDNYPFLKLTEIQDVFGENKIFEFDGKIKKIIVNTENNRITMINVTRKFENQEMSQAIFDLNQKELDQLLEYHSGKILYKDKSRIEAEAGGYSLNLIHERAIGKPFNPWIAFLCKTIR